LSDADAVFSFQIDYDRDPMSDDFRGIWDDMGNRTALAIFGKGTGKIQGMDIVGTLDGVFGYWYPAGPNLGLNGSFCRAVDHRFRFVKQ